MRKERSTPLFPHYALLELSRVGGAIMRHLALYPYNGGKKKNFSV